MGAAIDQQTNSHTSVFTTLLTDCTLGTSAFITVAAAGCSLVAASGSTEATAQLLSEQPHECMLSCESAACSCNSTAAQACTSWPAFTKLLLNQAAAFCACAPAYVMSLSLHCCGVISSCRYSSSRQGGPMWMPVYLHKWQHGAKAQAGGCHVPLLS